MQSGHQKPFQHPPLPRGLGSGCRGLQAAAAPTSITYRKALRRHTVLCVEIMMPWPTYSDSHFVDEETEAPSASYMICLQASQIWGWEQPRMADLGQKPSSGSPTPVPLCLGVWSRLPPLVSSSDRAGLRWAGRQPQLSFHPGRAAGLHVAGGSCGSSGGGRKLPLPVASAAAGLQWNLGADTRFVQEWEPETVSGSLWTGLADVRLH